MKYFEYRTTVSFEETNVVGNVYFSNFFVWQGKCREAFLRKEAPGVLEDFKEGHGMITQDSACQFMREAFAFDPILVRMHLKKLTRTGITMHFDYFRDDGDEPTLLAQGVQSVLWVNPQHRISMLPAYLYEAVQSYAAADPPAASGNSSPLAEAKL